MHIGMLFQFASISPSRKNPSLCGSYGKAGLIDICGAPAVLLLPLYNRQKLQTEYAMTRRDSVSICIFTLRKKIIPVNTQPFIFRTK